MSDPSLSPTRLSLTALEGIPEVTAGMALAPLIAAALDRHALVAAEDDVLLVCQKIVSKSEGQVVDLAEIQPSRDSKMWAKKYKLDARVIAKLEEPYQPKAVVGHT